jgi:hypothetical protein
VFIAMSLAGQVAASAGVTAVAPARPTEQVVAERECDERDADPDGDTAAM